MWYYIKIMKLISLNTWGGRAGLENLLQFIKKQADTGVDIFCFQEIWCGGHEHKIFTGLSPEALAVIERHLFQEIQAVLPEYTAYFRSLYCDFYGIAIFIKKSIPVTSEGEVFVYREKGYYSTENISDHGRNIQYIDTGSGPRTIINFHGLWTGNGKGDTPDRLLQSKNIVQFLKTIKNPFVLAGDFNLVPESESLQKFEQFGLKNLIRENNITSTRTSLYTKPIRFADYTFVSEGIQVNSFQVLFDEVSDHSPLYLDFDA